MIDDFIKDTQEYIYYLGEDQDSKKYVLKKMLFKAKINAVKNINKKNLLETNLTKYFDSAIRLKIQINEMLENEGKTNEETLEDARFKTGYTALTRIGDEFNTILSSV